MADFIYQGEIDLSSIEKSLSKVEDYLDSIAYHGKEAMDSIADEAVDTNRILGRMEEALDDIADSLRNTSRAGEGLGQKVGGGANSSALAFGLMNNAIDRTLTLMVSLGQIAGEALAKLVQSGVETAGQFESSQAVIKGVLQGNTEAAGEFFDLIRAESRKTGTDLTELAASFSSQVGSVDEFIRLSRIAAALAISQPEQGQVGARISLLEALQGDAAGLRSLRQRFELPPDAIDRIQQAQEEFGAAQGLIIQLEEELKNLGRDLDSLSGTFGQASARGQQFVNDLLAAFGEPIIEPLRDSLLELLENSEGVFAEVQALAGEAGEIVGNFIEAFDSEALLEFFEDNKQPILEFITALQGLSETLGELANAGLTDFLKSGDLGAITNFVIKLNDLVLAIQALGEVAEISQGRWDIGINGIKGALIGFFPILGTFTWLWENLPEVLLKVLEAANYVTAGFAFLEAGVSNLSLRIKEFSGYITEEELNAGLVDPFDAFNQKLAEGQVAINQYVAGGKELRREVQNITLTVKESNEAAKEQADDILAQRQALKDAEAAAIEFAEAQEKVKEALDKIDLERKRAEQDAYSKLLEQQAKQELKLAQDREKLERDFSRKIRELRIDAANDAAKKRRDIEQKAADQRVKIEQDYQKKIAKILQDAADSQLDAERERDAIQFLKIGEERDRKLRDAEQDRTDNLAQVETDRRRSVEELDQLDQELEQKIERERRYLADRQEELDIANQQRQVEIVDNYNKELEAIDLAEQRKLEDLQAKLADQLAILEAGLSTQLNLVTNYEASKTAIVQANAQARVDAIKAEIKAIDDLQKVGGGRGAGRQARSPRSAGGRSSARAALGFAEGTGGEFLTVPAGYPGDSFRIGLTSGEAFSVVPAGQQPQLQPMSNSYSSIINDMQRNLNLNGPFNFGAGQGQVEQYVSRLEFEQFMGDLLARLR